LDYRIERHGDMALFLREGRIPGLKHDRVLQDMSLADFLWILRKALGEDWQPREVMFTYAPHEDGQAYANYLAAPISFGATCQGIAFDASALEHEIHLTGPQLEALIRDVVSQTRAQADYALPEAVTQAIDLLLPTGRCCANSVATVFDIHARTLHRRLAEAGLTFSELLDTRRQKHAASYLLHTTMSSADVGVAVGYAAPEAFNRAFRRWHGVTPNRWRQAQTRD
jgi:AraC-like DNA-binding protein